MERRTRKGSTNNGNDGGLTNGRMDGWIKGRREGMGIGMGMGMGKAATRQAHPRGPAAKGRLIYCPGYTLES